MRIVRLRWVCALVAMLVMSTSARAITVDVLWYGQSAAYNTAMSTLAATAGTYDPDSDGSLDWNLTIWNSGDPTPTFGDYDVFVIGSSQAFGMGFSPTRLLAAKSDIEAARGSRTFLSGQDADFHYQNSPGAVDNGPRGFLINAVNWAASGTGMGIVSLPDGFSGTGSEWWTDADSFLKAETDGFVNYFQEESVVIPAATMSFPVNEGLTTAGLSNWSISAHLRIDKDAPGFLSINDSGQNPDFSVTLVTEGEAGGGTTGGGDIAVPEPATAGLGLIALGALALRRRRSA